MSSFFNLLSTVKYLYCLIQPIDGDKIKYRGPSPRLPPPSSYQSQLLNIKHVDQNNLYKGAGSSHIRFSIEFFFH